MEVDFLNDPANSHLFEEPSEPAEEPEHPVRAKKRKQPEKKERRDCTAQEEEKGTRIGKNCIITHHHF